MGTSEALWYVLFMLVLLDAVVLLHPLIARLTTWRMQRSALLEREIAEDVEFFRSVREVLL
jgi:hypothetical protein